VNKRPALRWLERSLWVTSLVLLGWVGFSLADGWLFQSRAEASLERALARVGVDLPELPGDQGSAADGPPSFGPVDLGDPLGRLEIPRLGLEVMVAEGTRGWVLRRGAGHLPGTPLPGDSGNVALAGHRDRHFRPLKDVAPGDEILLTTPHGTFRYRVEWTRIVEPKDVEVLDPTDQPTLTLVTCYPFYFVGNAPDRFIVRANQVGWRPPSAGEVDAVAAGR
jgi:sortase A